MERRGAGAPRDTGPPALESLVINRHHKAKPRAEALAPGQPGCEEIRAHKQGGCNPDIQAPAQAAS